MIHAKQDLEQFNLLFLKLHGSSENFLEPVSFQFGKIKN